MAYLGRWRGPVLDSADPYVDANVPYIPGLPVQKHVSTVMMHPDWRSATPFVRDTVKNLVMQYGAMYTAYFQSNVYYNYTSYNYYCYDSIPHGNHAVAIVGWDDNRPMADVGAPGPGAFIIKNSWGLTFGSNGYFYMSYYDKTLGEENGFFINAHGIYDFGSNYQYDPLGWVGSVGYTAYTAWGANVFTATANEELGAVGFYATSSDASYEISVYDTFDGTHFSGLQSSKSGTLDYPGYYVIDLDTLVPLTVGNTFGVVVKFTTPGYNYPIPIEYRIAGYSTLASASPGESYMSAGGVNFSDVTTVYDPTANVCIKALAVPEPCAALAVIMACAMLSVSRAWR